MLDVARYFAHHQPWGTLLALAVLTRSNEPNVIDAPLGLLACRDYVLRS